VCTEARILIMDRGASMLAMLMVASGCSLMSMDSFEP
jgi:hypothetical protein